MDNKLLVVRRPGQTYYEIKLDQKDVPTYVTINVTEVIRNNLNTRYYVVFGGKSVMFVDSAMFDALMSNGDMAYKDQIIIL